MLKQYQYDRDKNLTGLFVQSGNAILANNRYLYDGNGNRTHKQQLGGETLYHYDPLNQLQKVQYPGYTEELFYDKAGNRTRRVTPGTEELYQYDPRNRLTAYTKNGVTTLFRYDHTGNLLSDDKARYSYDAFNRTTQVETFDGNIQVNRYDAEGLRHEMEENGSLVKFIFNPDREAVVESGAHNLVRYIRSSELIARNTDAARTYYHYVSDEIGSTTHIVDEDGLVLNHYTYDAWGNLTAQEEAVPNRFKFTGQQLDPVTQQYYLRARFYNPVIARFTQEDTYRGDGLNLYAYCANRPTYYIDPTGHWCDTKQDTFNKLASERGLDPDKMDYDTKQRLMAEASNIVKEQNKKSNTASQTDVLHQNQPVKPVAQIPESTSATRPLTWNEFQSANQGKYSQSQMSEAWNDYKKSHYPNEGQHYLVRPYIRQSTIDKINKKTKVNSQGQIYDPIGNKWISPADADLGHVPSHEFWYERDLAEAQKMTQAQFNDYMNNPDFYVWQNRHDNLSHVFEDRH